VHLDVVAAALAVITWLERELWRACQREIEDRERCERLLAPLRVLRARLEDRASEVLVRELLG
jgi:hypothetical protein